MHISNETRLKEFSEKHSDAKSVLTFWRDSAIGCNAGNIADLKRTFGTVDYVQPKSFVFNIGGNKYRLIATIHFDSQTLFIRHVLTHKEYDEWTRNNRNNRRK